MLLSTKPSTRTYTMTFDTVIVLFPLLLIIILIIREYYYRYLHISCSAVPFISIRLFHQLFTLVLVDCIHCRRCSILPIWHQLMPCHAVEISNKLAWNRLLGLGRVKKWKMPSVTRNISVVTCRISKNPGVIRSPLCGASRQQYVGMDALLRGPSLCFFQSEDRSTDFFK